MLSVSNQNILMIHYQVPKHSVILFSQSLGIETNGQFQYWTNVNYSYKACKALGMEIFRQHSLV